MISPDVVSQLHQIALKAFPQVTDECTSEMALSFFIEIEAMGPDGYDAIADQLSSTDRVYKLLAKVGTPASKYAEYALDKGNEYVRNAALHLLAEISSFDKLESILIDPKNHLQNDAARLLGFHWQVEILGNALNNQDEQIRCAAIQGLEAVTVHRDIHKKTDTRYELTIKFSISVLHDTNPTIRWYALVILERLNQLTVDILTKAIHDSSIQVRQSAAGGLFSLGINASTAPLLAEIIEDINAEISETAIKNISRHSSNVDPQILGNTIIDILVLRNTGLPSKNFSPEQISQALQKTISLSYPLREQVLSRLADLAYSHEDSVRTRSVRVAQRVGGSDFSALIQERSAENPSAAKAILHLLGEHAGTNSIINELSKAAPDDVQKISTLQTELLQGYYANALQQTQESFRWAVVSMMVSLSCLLCTAAYLLISISIGTKTSDLVGILTGIGSVLSSFISGGQFWLYDRAGKRLAQSQLQLHQVQTFGSVILDMGFEDWAQAGRKDWQTVHIMPGFVFGHRSVA